jgi:predicted N-formylglutamate amidohydrolase
VRLLITCEHGGNGIPAKYWPLFKSHRHLLQSHRGFDPGALSYARDFAKAFDAELIYSTTSRLLIELNRSPGHPEAFSEITRGLPPDEKQVLLQHYYLPYRDRVEAYVAQAVRDRDRVLHVSCHSFTPRLHGVTRRADIGLLYDPRRASEARFCAAWKRALQNVDTALVVRRNYPYRGNADGLTTHLRRRVADRRYAGIEIEVNQKFPYGQQRAWRALRKRLVKTLEQAIANAF